MILAFLLKVTRYYGFRVKRILELYVGDKKHDGIFYAIKCFLKENGLKSPFVIYGFLLTIFPFFVISIKSKYLDN